MTKWIFISPHFDDVVLSTGGLVWELTHKGDTVEVWTICAGDPPFDKPLTEYGEMLHGLWELPDDVPYRRSQEDAACCKLLGAAATRRFTIPDNIYRYYPGTDDPVVKEPEDNQTALEPEESYLIPYALDFLRKNIMPGWEIAAPLAIGHHRDHVITRKAVDRLGIPVWHFIDFPYVVTGEYDVKNFVPKDCERFDVKITQTGLEAWQNGFVCHRSQIPLLFSDEEEARNAIERYNKAGNSTTALYKF
jgi:LmbE family N-acetylglucosaminyl deacetylase